MDEARAVDMQIRELLLPVLAQRDLLTRIVHLVAETDVNRLDRSRQRTRESALLAIQVLARTSVAQRGAEIEDAARRAEVPLGALLDDESRVWTLMANDPAYGIRPEWRHPWSRD